jgi:hypothetical protein
MPKGVTLSHAVVNAQRLADKVAATICPNSHALFPSNSSVSGDNPAMFAPGRTKLAMSSDSIGSLTASMMMATEAVACSAEGRCGPPHRKDDVTLAPNQVGRERVQPLLPALRGSVVQRDGLPLHVAQLVERLPEGFEAWASTGHGQRTPTPGTFPRSGATAACGATSRPRMLRFMTGSPTVHGRIASARILGRECSRVLRVCQPTRLDGGGRKDEPQIAPKLLSP